MAIGYGKEIKHMINIYKKNNKWMTSNLLV